MICSYILKKTSTYVATKLISSSWNSAWDFPSNRRGRLGTRLHYPHHQHQALKNHCSHHDLFDIEGIALNIITKHNHHSWSWSSSTSSPSSSSSSPLLWLLMIMIIATYINNEKNGHHPKCPLQMYNRVVRCCERVYHWVIFFCVYNRGRIGSWLLLFGKER